jgi:rare lipoprotein A
MRSLDAQRLGPWIRVAWLLLLVLLVLLLSFVAGCASRPPKPVPAPPVRTGSDGPGTHPPSNLQQAPDAQPRVEPLRLGGPNKPYEVQGQRYVPLTGDVALTESGGASWYGRKFHGLPTANGEVYDMYAMTAAHKTLPLPSYARVSNPANGKSVIVRVNDRGPFVAGRVIDLSYTAALKLGVLNSVTTVQVQRLTFDEIRAMSLLDDAPQ